jgi:hypothetical protein
MEMGEQFEPLAALISRMISATGNGLTLAMLPGITDATLSYKALLGILARSAEMNPVRLAPVVVHAGDVMALLFPEFIEPVLSLQRIEAAVEELLAGGSGTIPVYQSSSTLRSGQLFLNSIDLRAAGVSVEDSPDVADSEMEHEFQQVFSNVGGNIGSRLFYVLRAFRSNAEKLRSPYIADSCEVQLAYLYCASLGLDTLWESHLRAVVVDEDRGLIFAPPISDPVYIKKKGHYKMLQKALGDLDAKLASHDQTLDSQKTLLRERRNDRTRLEGERTVILQLISRATGNTAFHEVQLLDVRQKLRECEAEVRTSAYNTFPVFSSVYVY